MLSAACKESIRAMIYITHAGGDRNIIPVKEIAQKLNTSFYFLAKNIQRLVKAGLLFSYKGPKGGVKLAKRPEDIKLIDIVEAIDGLEFFETCLLGFKECSDEHPCAIHHKWADKRKAIYKMFSETSLKEVVNDMEKNCIEVIF